MSRVCSKCFRGSSSRKLGQDAWTEWEGRCFFFSFPFRFFFFNSFYFILFLPSLKLSRNINLIENTYCTCTGYLVIKKQQRTTNEETGETCSIFRFWIWVGRILWGSISSGEMEPPSPLISWVNPFPSRFINRTACFPRKVSYFCESRMSPWKKWNWMKSNSEARPSTVFLFYYTSIFTVLQPLGSGMK